MKPRLLIVFLFFFMSGSFWAQQSVTLRGKVVEITPEGTVGVPGVVVSVSGESYDVTAQDGSFKLFAPGGLDQITITIKGSSSMMISPYEGKVSIPPLYEPIEIKLCQEKNEQLINKINQLNARIRSLQKTQKLTHRQMEQMHQTMLDTITFYQARLDLANRQLEKAEVANQELKNKITELEKSNALLEEKLFLALGEKFATQQKHFESISAGLNNFISRLKDLHHILPTDAEACLSNAPGACNRFYGYIEKYNQARNYIHEHQDEDIRAAAHFWSDPRAAAGLKEIYRFILDTIHEPYLFDKMNTTVIQAIKQRSQGNTGLKAAKKQVAEAGNTLAADLEPLIRTLDEKKSILLTLLTNSIQ
jgi:DNA repair exonuclease SbcCD ATPase subunit